MEDTMTQLFGRRTSILGDVYWICSVVIGHLEEVKEIRWQVMEEIPQQLLGLDDENHQKCT